MTFALRTLGLVITLALGWPAGNASAQDSLPPARTVDVVDHPFGLTLPDPYRWMEGQKNPEFQAWLKAQGEATRKQLDAMPTLARWRATLKQASAAGVRNKHQMRVGDTVFFLRSSGAQSGILMARSGGDPERMLLDPEALKDASGTASITTFSPSPDGRRVAVNIDRNGSEITRIVVLDSASGKPTGDALGPVWGEFPAFWQPDGSGFTYIQMRRPPAGAGAAGGDPMQGMRVRLHTLGTPAASDPLLLTAGDGPGANPHFAMDATQFPVIDAGADSPWAVALAVNARPERRVCVAPREQALKPGASWRCLVDFDDQVQGGALHGNTLYLLSMKGHPNGRLLAIDLADSHVALAQAREVMPSTADSVITDIVAARDALYVKRMRAGIDHIDRLDYASGKASEIPLPRSGTAMWFNTQPQTDGLIYTLQSWTNPRVAYAYREGKSVNLELGESTPVPHKDIVAEEIEATSADGTHVPLTILHKKNLPHDGGNRSLLFAYGGYGMAIQPAFRPDMIAWVNAGNVAAIAHVRGGGEKGDAWHRAGQGPLKHKGVEDFVACADALVEAGYSRVENVALMSASMGGLLIGGAVTRFPRHMGAAVIQVGMLNPVRLLQQVNGANQIGEVGDPRTPAGMKALAAMDPYQHIEKDTAYPAVLLTVGLNDGRVATWETGKFAARLRTARSNQRPVWIRTNGEAGHGANSMDAAAAESADIYAFLDAQLPGRGHAEALTKVD